MLLLKIVTGQGNPSTLSAWLVYLMF